MSAPPPIFCNGNPSSASFAYSSAPPPILRQAYEANGTKLSEHRWGKKHKQREMERVVSEFLPELSSELRPKLFLLKALPEPSRVGPCEL